MINFFGYKLYNQAELNQAKAESEKKGLNQGHIEGLQVPKTGRLLDPDVKYADLVGPDRDGRYRATVVWRENGLLKAEKAVFGPDGRVLTHSKPWRLHIPRLGE